MRAEGPFVLAHYESATPAQRDAGRGWYPAAYDLCEQIGRGRIPTETVARVMAILSPRTFWRTNVTWTEKMVAAYLAGQPCPAVSTGGNRDKAWRELHGERTISGPKVEAFARAIMGDPDAVVIDSWILRTVGLQPNSKVTDHRLRWITELYHELAVAMKETPRDMQAIVWCAIRGRSA